MNLLPPASRAQDDRLVVERVALDTNVEQLGITLWRTKDQNQYFYTPTLEVSSEVYLSEFSNTIGFWVRIQPEFEGRTITLQLPNTQQVMLRDYLLETMFPNQGTKPTTNLAILTQAELNFDLLDQEGSFNFVQSRTYKIADFSKNRYTRVDFNYSGERISGESLPPPFSSGSCSLGATVSVNGKYESWVTAKITVQVKQQLVKKAKGSGKRIFIWHDNRDESESTMREWVTVEESLNSGYRARPEDRELIENWINRVSAACFTKVSGHAIPTSALVRVPNGGFFEKSWLDKASNDLEDLFKGSQSNQDWPNQLEKVLSRVPDSRLQVNGRVGETGPEGDRAELMNAARESSHQGKSLDQFLENASIAMPGPAGKASIALKILKNMRFSTGSFSEVIKFDSTEKYEREVRSFGDQTQVIVYTIGVLPVSNMNLSARSSAPAVLDLRANAPQAPAPSANMIASDCNNCKGRGATTTKKTVHVMCNNHNGRTGKEIDRPCTNCRSEERSTIATTKSSTKRCTTCDGWGLLKYFGDGTTQQLSSLEAKQLGRTQHK